MILDQRPMKVFADGVEVGEKLHKSLKGKTVMSLMPDFYILGISGISDGDLNYLKGSNEIKVTGEDNTVLCIGKAKEIYQHQEDMNTMTSISIADGMAFWKTIANQSVGKGASVRNTLVTILNGVPLASYLADDVRLIRGQAFLDRLPDAVSALAKSAGGRAFFTQGQVHVVKKGSTSSVLSIPDKEIIDNPGFSNGVCTLKTKVKGYPVGLLTTIEGKSKKYRLVMQSLNADNWNGEWISELMLVDEDYIENMGGG